MYNNEDKETQTRVIKQSTTSTSEGIDFTLLLHNSLIYQLRDHVGKLRLKSMNATAPPPKPAIVLATPINVEESRAQRLQRQQARFRDRGG